MALNRLLIFEICSFSSTRTRFVRLLSFDISNFHCVKTQRLPGILRQKTRHASANKTARGHTRPSRRDKRGAKSNSRAVFLDALAARSPLAFRVQLLDGGLDDLFLQRGVLLDHPPSSFQILGEVFPRHRLLHLLQTSQHLGGVARELLECHAYLAKGATINVKATQRVVR